MNPENRPFLSWFGYSRRERRSTFILFVILIIVIAIRYFVPSKEIAVEDLSELLASADSGKENLSDIGPEIQNLFIFDPNSASYDTLTELGLSEKQARTILSYRNKGGSFRKPSDIKRIYGIDEQTAVKLIPFISIKRDMENVSYNHVDSTASQKIREKVDLNRADSAALEMLPQIGPVLSSRIIKYRKLLGGFVSSEQLKEVYGLSEATYNILAERVFADSSIIKFININNAGYKELSKHPYLNSYDIQAILKYRELKGSILNIGELIDNKILTVNKAKKISPYLKF
jgi:competence protein ComEA